MRMPKILLAHGRSPFSAGSWGTPDHPSGMYTYKLSLHVPRAVAHAASCHHADLETNTCLMLKRQEVCFSGGVQRTGLGELWSLRTNGRNSSLYSVNNGSLRRRWEVNYKMQGWSLRCLFPSMPVPWRCPERCSGDRLPKGHPLPFELNSLKTSRPSLKS